MPLNPHKKEDINKRLVAGESIRVISEAVGVPLGAVQHLRGELLQHTNESAIEEMIYADPALVQAIGQNVKELGQATHHITKGMVAVQKLQPKLVNAMEDVTDKITEYMQSKDFKIDKLPMVVKALTDINEALYSTKTVNNAVQVNINQQTIEAEKKAESLKALQKMAGFDVDVVEAEIDSGSHGN